MPTAQFSAEAHNHETYGLPQQRLENWFAEAVSDREDFTHRLIPTPGLTAFSDQTGTLGRGCFQSDAIASGEIIYVIDTAVRRVNSSGTSATITGTVVNDGLPVRFANSQAQAVINSGGEVSTVTASAVTEFTSALTSAGASGDIIDVAVLNNRHIYIEDNSGRAFYSGPGDATTIPGFVTAESDPDQLKACIVSGGSLLLFGSKKTEFWTGTDSTTTPLIPRQGYVLDVGIIATDAKCLAGSLVCWAGNDGSVYGWSGGREQRISPHWMERSISSLSAANKAKIRMSAHDWNGHSFAKIYIPTVGDFFYDTLVQRWHRRKDLIDTEKHWGFDYFVEAFGSVHVQKLTGGVIHTLSADVFTEADIAVRRVATVAVPVKKKTSIRNVIVESQPGVGLDLTTGQGVDPRCMLRVALDGHVYGAEQMASIGRLGQYGYRPTFGPQGMATHGLAIAELSYSDPVGWTVYGLTFNETP